MRLGGPRNRSGRGGGEKNFHPLPELEPPNIQPVAQRYTTELSQLIRLILILSYLYLGLASSFFLSDFVYEVKCASDLHCAYSVLL
jgi:hypothetical protein